jgi:hypothetical protein
MAPASAVACLVPPVCLVSMEAHEHDTHHDVAPSAVAANVLQALDVLGHNTPLRGGRKVGITRGFDVPQAAALLCLAFIRLDAAEHVWPPTLVTCPSSLYTLLKVQSPLKHSTVVSGGIHVRLLWCHPANPVAAGLLHILPVD